MKYYGAQLFLILGLFHIISNILAQEQSIFDPQELIEYARQNNLKLPEKDPSIGVIWTLNKYGANFAPIDPISSSYFADIVQSNNVKALEIGCGYGMLATNIFKHKKPTDIFDYTAIDLDKRHLAIATAAIASLDTPNSYLPSYLDKWHPVQGAFPYVDFDQKFTHIGMFYVFHFLNPQTAPLALQKLEELLEIGGKAYIYTAHYKSSTTGKMLSLWYNVRYYAGYEFPGYIANSKEKIETLIKYGLFPKRYRQNANFIQSASENFLTMDTSEFITYVKKYTMLHVYYAATIDSCINNIDRKHIGIILEKVSK